MFTDGQWLGHKGIRRPIAPSLSQDGARDFLKCDEKVSMVKR